MDSALVPTGRDVRAPGFVLVAAGLLCLLIPMASPARAVALLGWMLGLAAAIEIVNAFETRHRPGYGWRAIGGLLWAGAGIFMLVRPIWGTVGVAIALGLVLVMRGVVHAAQTYELKNPWFIVAALFSLSLGALAIAGWPGDSVVVLAVLAGAALLIDGLSYSFGFVDSRTRSVPSTRSSHM